MPEPLSSYHADPADQLITYEGLPAANGGAHALAGRDPLAAADRIEDFLAACLRIDRAADAVLHIDALAEASAQDTAAIESALRGRFGEPSDQDAFGAEWAVPEAPKDRADALTLVAAAARAGHPGLSLRLAWTGRLLDPETAEPYPGISAAEFGDFEADGSGRLLGASEVRASIGSGRSTIGLWLNLPADERLAPAVAALSEALPIRLAAHHWKRWQPTRDGSAYRFFQEPSPLG